MSCGACSAEKIEMKEEESPEDRFRKWVNDQRDRGLIDEDKKNALLYTREIVKNLTRNDGNLLSASPRFNVKTDNDLIKELIIRIDLAGVDRFPGESGQHQPKGSKDSPVWTPHMQITSMKYTKNDVERSKGGDATECIFVDLNTLQRIWPQVDYKLKKNQMITLVQKPKEKKRSTSKLLNAVVKYCKGLDVKKIEHVQFLGFQAFSKVTKTDNNGKEYKGKVSALVDQYE